ncbi:multicopper oxidase family protein [Kribbella sp. DT2]|uniref:multicopper oxidase family protein n=1 Tax=Kribbella sp. DT2 TaxID=3393427 RepID=UPI003CFA4531
MSASTEVSEHRFSRRQLLAAGAVGLIAAGGGFAGVQLVGGSEPVGPHNASVASMEASRRRSGRTVRRTLRAGVSTVELGGETVQTWAFDDAVPGPVMRASVGDELRIRLANGLPDPTTVHWHGVALRNDMDGVPGLTMDPVPPGGSFDYSFLVPDPGTYWFHPHVGVQLDTGLYGALIVDDPNDVADYDRDVVLFLDDWTDGLGRTPTTQLELLRRDGMPMDGMDMSSDAFMPSATQPLGGDTGDVRYPAHLINGRLPKAPATIACNPRDRVRLRIINAAADTAYRFAIGEHRLTVTHADGFAVAPVEVDTLIIGMGERYDVVITAADGAFPVVAVAEGKAHPETDPPALAVLRSGSGSPPRPGVRPSQLNARMLSYADLRPAVGTGLESATPDTEHDVRLQMAHGGRGWFINGKPYGRHAPLEVRAGDRVRLHLRNESMMFHPVHVHGHTFALVGPQGPGVRKDTINVLPMQQLSVDLQADNPGQWLVHCHNAYHSELGMMTDLSYVS